MPNASVRPALIPAPVSDAIQNSFLLVSSCRRPAIGPFATACEPALNSGISTAPLAPCATASRASRPAPLSTGPIAVRTAPATPRPTTRSASLPTSSAGPAGEINPARSAS
jgi:hypothetical protein